MAGEMVKYHNQLSDLALRNFNAAELDILMAICNRMRNKKTEIFKFDFTELRQLTKSKERHDKRFADSIRKTNKKLLELNIMLQDDENPGTTVQFALFKRFRTSEERQTLEVSVNEEFAFVLNALSENFTRFELEEFVELKSSYSKACYRQLKRYRDTGWWQVDIADFRRLLDVPKSYKTNDVTTFVLKPIEEEIPKLFDNLSIKKIRGTGRGKPIKSLYFSFSKQIDILTSEERKDNYKKTGIKCPCCGEPLVEKSINGAVAWCHVDGWKEDAKCNKIFNSIAEIKGIEEEPTKKEQQEEVVSEELGN